jgi:hypothetical protein
MTLILDNIIIQNQFIYYYKEFKLFLIFPKGLWSTVHDSDLGPAPNQTDPGKINGTTHSSVLLPDPNINIQKNCTR